VTLNEPAAQREPIWIVPVLSGSVRRVGDVMTTDGAAWSPDGRQIAYAVDHELRVVKSDGTESRTVVSAPGAVRHVRWSPDGARLRFSVAKEGQSIWEVRVDGKQLHSLPIGWNELRGNRQPDEWPLSWTPDGAYFLFGARRDGKGDIWAIREKASWFRKASHEPVRLTTGPGDAWGATLSKDGRKLFVLSEHKRAGSWSATTQRASNWCRTSADLGGDGVLLARRAVGRLRAVSRGHTVALSR